jgi:hypothetical protein
VIQGIRKKTPIIDTVLAIRQLRKSVRFMDSLISPLLVLLISCGFLVADKNEFSMRAKKKENAPDTPGSKQSDVQRIFGMLPSCNRLFHQVPFPCNFPRLRTGRSGMSIFELVGSMLHMLIFNFVSWFG